MLEVESSLSNDDIIEEPIHNFLMENEDLLKYIKTKGIK